MVLPPPPNPNPVFEAGVVVSTGFEPNPNAVVDAGVGLAVDCPPNAVDPPNVPNVFCVVGVVVPDPVPK